MQSTPPADDARTMRERVLAGDHHVADVRIGPDVQPLPPTHPVEAEPRRPEEVARPITVGDDVWPGGGAIVLPGVTTGADTVVGAGSVLTRDLPAGVVAAGDPARVARTLART